MQQREKCKVSEGSVGTKEYFDENQQYWYISETKITCIQRLKLSYTKTRHHNHFVVVITFHWYNSWDPKFCGVAVGLTFVLLMTHSTGVQVSASSIAMLNLFAFLDRWYRLYEWNFVLEWDRDSKNNKPIFLRRSLYCCVSIRRVLCFRGGGWTPSNEARKSRQGVAVLWKSIWCSVWSPLFLCAPKSRRWHHHRQRMPNTASSRSSWSDYLPLSTWTCKNKEGFWAQYLNGGEDLQTRIFQKDTERQVSKSETIVLVRVTSSFGKNRNKKDMIAIRVFEKVAATALMLALLNGGDKATVSGFSATSLTGCPRAASTAASSLTQLPTQMSSGLFAFQNEDVLDDTSTTTTSNVCSSRGQFLKGIMMFTASTLALGTSHVEPSYAKSYSSNARNMERLNSGDASGGSVYNNNPTSEAGKKRRAMTGCKSSTAREEAAENVLKVKSLSEYECNQIVMNDGETEFMLSSLRKLECPTCPYGISSSR